MSGAQPWMKFYPSDWRSDPRLRMCCLAARGLWMEMLALMHEAVPYGHLLISGIAPTDAQLAVLAGAPSEQIPVLLGELETAGVFSRTSKSVIYSRRMARDDKKARTARKNGKNGGNPTLCLEKEIPPSVNPQDKGGDKAQIPEAREEHTKEADASLGADGADEEPEQTESQLVWRGGLKWLMRETKLTEPKARELLGKWCKGGREALVLGVLRECRDHTPPILDPVPWIVAAIAERSKPNDRHAQQHRPASRSYVEDPDTRRAAIIDGLARSVDACGTAA